MKTQFKSIEIYNVGGVLIQQFEIEDFKADQLINISMLQSGIYFLSLKNETIKSAIGINYLITSFRVALILFSVIFNM